MPSSVDAVKKTASLFWQMGQRTSRVRGSVGSDRTSCSRGGGGGRGGAREGGGEWICRQLEPGNSVQRLHTRWLGAAMQQPLATSRSAAAASKQHGRLLTPTAT